MRTIDRLLRRMRGDGGFSVVEMMLALTLLGIAMAGLAQLIGSMLVGTIDNRERETGVALANEIVEEVRSRGYTSVKLMDGPADFTDDDGTYPTIVDATCADCIAHSVTVTKDRFDYAVTTWVLGIDDVADGLGVSDADGETVDYKRVVVDIGSTSDVGFTYRAETLIHDTSAAPSAVVEGMAFEIQDPDNLNRVVEEDFFHWTLDISGSGVSGLTIEEGTYENFAIAPGSYNCTIGNTMSTQGWHPQGSPSADSETFPCSVVAGQITSIVRFWQQDVACTATGVTNDLEIAVTDASGQAIAGAAVDPAPTAGQPDNPAPGATGIDGKVIFPSAWTGSYILDVSAVGFEAEAGIFVCLTSTEATEPHLTVVLQEVALPAAQVHVEIKSKCKGAETFKVALEGGPTYYEEQQQLSQDQVVTFVFDPVEFGEYDIRVYHLKNGSWNKRKEDKSETFSEETPPYEYGTWDIKC